MCNVQKLGFADERLFLQFTLEYIQRSAKTAILLSKHYNNLYNILDTNILTIL